MVFASRILQQKRQAVCDTCIHKLHDRFIQKTEICGACGCMLKPKIACAMCDCPKGKWKKITTGI